jgi:hypothetical protein
MAFLIGEAKSEAETVNFFAWSSSSSYTPTLLRSATKEKRHDGYLQYNTVVYVSVGPLDTVN